MELSTEDRKTIERIANGVWQYIGHDIMEALEAEGKDSIPKDHVVEVVMDSFESHWRTIVMQYFRKEKDRVTALVEEFWKQSFDYRKEIIDGAFSFQWYA